ncbi:MAG: hypothetical protein OM95_03520 [Bdellovibrio sp. ArHS]|nr:MAG: hypothetical protein OM95_03520 [Bdellovibrio sp. ArHS]
MEQIGRFQILRSLASGGMADIFLARKIGDPSSQLFVIKRIGAQADDKWFYSKLFLREAKLSISLNHPNLVQTLEMGTHEGNLYLVQEYIEGVNLKEIMSVVTLLGRFFPTSMVYYIMAKVSLGLSYMHGHISLQSHQQICLHRDLSPHNIMLSRGGEVKIIDFGVSKSSDSESLTQAGTIKGKYTYMSPEQLCGENVTPASDIFALGIIYYELLTGKRFFSTSTELETIQALSQWSLEEVQKRILDVGTEDARILQSMLDPDPQRRVSALQLAAVFETSLKSLDAHYGVDQFAATLREYIGESASGLNLSKGNQSTESLTAQSEISEKKPSMQQHITLYEVLTEKPRTSSLNRSLLTLSFAVLFGGYLFWKVDDDTSKKRVPASLAPVKKEPRSLLLKFDQFKNNKSLEVSLNGARVLKKDILAGIKVFDGDQVAIRFYSLNDRRWKSSVATINTSSSPIFSEAE